MILLIFSCKHTNTETGEITPKQLILTDFTVDKIATNIKYISLDKSVLLSNVSDVKKSENGFLVKTNTGLFLFNNDGTFVNRIGKKGKGPGEYTSVDDFVVDDVAKHVYVLNRKQVKVYNFLGEYIRSFFTPEKQTFAELEINNNNLYFPKGFGLTALNYEWFETDFSGNIIRKKANYLKNINDLRINYKTNLSFNINGNLYYWNQFNDTIFQIDSSPPSAAFIFKKDNYRITPDDLSTAENFRNKASWQLISIFGSKRYLFLEYVLIKEGVTVFTTFDVQTGNHYLLHKKMFGEELLKLNSFDTGPALTVKSIFEEDNSVWCINWIYPFHLKTLITSKNFKTSMAKYPKKKKELEQLANNLDENDNPVLMLVKLKE